MSQAVGRTWGQWISERSDFVGYNRQQDLADDVGCTRERIVKWFASNEPPARMRKGFDESLARALKIDRMTLLRAWREVEPKDVPLSDYGHDKEVPWDRDHPLDERKRKGIGELLWLLEDDDLEEVRRFASKKIRERIERLEIERRSRRDREATKDRPAKK